MNKTNTILALMALSAASAFAGVEPAPAPSGKGGAVVAPVDPCAVPISYNNVELLYANTDLDGQDEDGLNFRVEYSPWKNIYLVGNVTYTDADHGEAWTLSGGIGGYLPLTDNIHLAADVGITYWDWDYTYVYAVPVGAGGGGPQYYNDSDSDTGFYARPHIRAKWGCFEAHTGVYYVDVNEDDWAWFIQAYYQVAPGWDITAGYTTWDDSDADTWSIGARYKF